MNKVLACDKCGETVQDDPQQALGKTHISLDAPSCNGVFVFMTESQAAALSGCDGGDKPIPHPPGS